MLTVLASSLWRLIPAAKGAAIGGGQRQAGRAWGITKPKKLASESRGSVSVEAALVISLVLIPLLLGIWDYASILAVQARLDEALNAAVEYADSSPANATNKTAIANAATTAYGNATPSLALTGPTLSYYCIAVSPAGTKASGTAAIVNTNCGSGEVLATYATLSLAATVALPVAAPGLGATYPLAETATVRVN